MNSIQYVAFLRGINVGGVLVKMADLKVIFESLGFQNVRTLLASGNVIFEANETKEETLVLMIEEALTKRYGRHIAVLVRSLSDMQRLVDSEPFKAISVTPQTRLYVTFLTQKPENLLKIPYESPEKDFWILHVSDGEVLSVKTLTNNGGTTDMMGFIEKEFGKNVTTRNWNTIEKIVKNAF